VIKASKQCNLRCAYCYEFNELADPRRMPFELWHKILAAIRTHNEIETARHGRANISSIVWHGGEPLLLPLDYMKQVIALQHEVFGPLALSREHFPNNMQTNCYVVREEQVEFLKANNFSISVSVDVIPGVRLSVNGKPTEKNVIANVARLRAAGFNPGGIAVLASHTAKEITKVYDFFESMRMSFRILPLFEGPSERPMDRFNLTIDEIVSAMERLFLHWMEKETAIPVVPFIEYVEVALRKMTDLGVARYDRRVGGDKVFVVNTNGDLYLVQHAYAEHKKLGNLMDQTYEEIIGSPRYVESIEEEISEQNARCGTCDYRHACTGWPLFATRYPNEDVNAPCPVASRSMAFIEKFFRENGFTKESLLAMAGDKAPQFREMDALEA